MKNTNNAKNTSKKITWESFGELLNKKGVLLCNLWERWQDEKEYEDIEDYGKVIAKELGFKSVEMSKRPFGFKVPCTYNNKVGTAFAKVTCKGTRLALNASFTCGK